MGEFLKRYFIPHSDNNYKPHLLREFSVVFLILLTIFVIPIFTLLYSRALNGNFLLGAIFPQALVSLANEARVADGESPLGTSQTLEMAARLKAEDMASKGYFAHVSPEGQSPWYWLKQAGYSFSYAGENLAVDFSDSADVSRAWLDSPGHRANILNKNFLETGIAISKGMYQGRETTFVVQFFGRQALTKTLSKATDPSSAKVAAAKPVENKNTNVLSESESLEIIEETDKFVAVKAEGAEPITVAAKNIWQYDDIKNKVLETASSPRLMAYYAYFFMAFLVALSLIFVVAIEASRRHPAHIIYGIFLLLLIVFSAYVVNFMAKGSVVII